MDLRILIIDPLHESFMNSLRERGIDHVYYPDISEEAIRSSLGDFQGLVLRSKIKMDRALIAGNPQLRLIARAGSGMDGVDMQAAIEADIACINAPEGNRDAVGEQTVGMMLSVLANINKGNREVRHGTWDREGNRGRELSSQTIGIIGYGNTGSAVTEKLSGFGCRILAYDKYRSGFGGESVEECSYETILEHADVISFHIPHTEETESWINDDFVKSVQKPFDLFNLSRGGIMDTASVIRGLRSGKIVGFGADVLENEKFEEYTNEEKLQRDTLLNMPNVIVTPHVGGWTNESFRRISEVLSEKVLSWINESVLMTE